MIVVSLTSWKKRIGNCKKVVESIMANTVKPDRVYLNLSREEFSGVPLPKDLIEYFYSDDRLIINWVDGPNTKQFKKVFPILRFLDPEDIVIATDDDILLPEDFIEIRIREFNSHGGRHPISSALKKCYIGDTYVVSTPITFKAKMMDNWDKFVDRTVYDTGNDDRCMLYVFWLNGYATRPTERWSKRGLDNNFAINPTGALKGSYIVGKSFDEAVKEKVEELTGTTIEKSFGFFRKPVAAPKTEGKHDVVIPWCHNGIASKMMECGNRLELEYVVASMYKFCSSWLGRIFVVGSEPPESLKDKVIHVPCDDPYTHCKDANIIHKILFACENIPDLTEDFVKASDDQIVTCETSYEDLVPRIVRRYSDWTEEQWNRNRRMDIWHDNLWLTLHLFDTSKCYFAEPHIWAPFNKHRYIEMCNKYNWRKSRACIDNTLYYNFIDYPPIDQFDHLHLSRREAQKIIPTLRIKDLPRHLSWTDSAFVEKRFRTILDQIIFEND